MVGPQRLGRHLTSIAGKALGKNGLAFGALITDWPSIVGSRLADQTGPLKMVFPQGKREQAVLHLRVSSPAALLLQHEEPQLVERINAYMGWRAVARLKLVHAGPALKPKSYTVAPRKLTKQQQEAISTTAAAVEDPALREALERLGRSMGAGST